MKYLKILITNQPAVAKGYITIKGLQKSFKILETILQIIFLMVFTIVLTTQIGYKGENKKFKINCSCRKPKPGLILKLLEILI